MTNINAANSLIITTYGHELSVTKNLLKEIEAYEQISQTDQKGTTHKNKRSIDMIGDILNVIAGVPTKGMHESLIERVNLIENNALNLQDLNSRQAENIKHLADEMSKLHETISDAVTVLKTQESRIDKLESFGRKVVRTVDFIAVSSEINTLASANLRKIESIYSASKTHRLSPFAIPPSKLFEEISQLSFDDNPLTPIYMYGVSQYYNGKFTRGSWKGDTLHISMGIPLINRDEPFIISFLTDKEKIESTVDLSGYVAKATNPHTNGYILLTNSDLNECSEFHPGRFICKKRSIEIFSDSIAIHEISPEVFMFNLGMQKETTAKILCDGFQTDLHIKSGIHYLGSHCEIQHPDFRIRKTKKENGTFINHEATKIDVKFRQAQHEIRREGGSVLLEKIVNDTATQKNKIERIRDETDELAFKYKRATNDIKNHNIHDMWTKGGITTFSLISFLFLLCLHLHLRAEVNRMKFGK